ncbi:MAG TPA: hypothetical protein VNE38_16175 [Ktedonobacteraceae bacterium]|nr:hypothetical protein [Ktedonobacteraceae bacterium]
MYRIVHVIARDGKTLQVPLTAQQAAFYMRLAQFKSTSNPVVTFGDLLAEKREKELRLKSNQYN